jgi:periplasmic copper chaperone A
MAWRMLIFAGFLLTAAAWASAQEGIRVLAAWSRATPGPTAAAYLELRNEGPAADRLVGAASPIAERIEIHEHRITNGVMSMGAVPSVVLPAGDTVSLAPGGRHLMLFGLSRPLRPGERFALTLRFQAEGEITVEAKVGSAGAMSPPP